MEAASCKCIPDRWVRRLQTPSPWICWEKPGRRWEAAPWVSSTLPWSPGARQPCLSTSPATSTSNWRTCREPVRGGHFDSPHTTTSCDGSLPKSCLPFNRQARLRSEEWPISFPGDRRAVTLSPCLLGTMGSLLPMPQNTMGQRARWWCRKLPPCPDPPSYRSEVIRRMTIKTWTHSNSNLFSCSNTR